MIHTCPEETPQTKAELKLLRALVLHNHLVPEPNLDSMIHELHDPQQVIEKMLVDHLVEEPTVVRLRHRYEHILEQKRAKHGATSQKPGSAHDHEAHASKHEEPSKPPEAKPVTEVGETTTGKDAEEAHPVRPVAPPDKASTPDVVPVQISVASEPAPLTYKTERDMIFKLLRTARAMKSSDVYLIANVVPTLRIASVLRALKAPILPAAAVEKALQAVLTPAQFEHFTKTHDLDCSFSGGPGLGRFRVNVSQELHGPAAVFRLIPEQVPTFDALHLPEQMRRFTQYRQGMVLITGPKGSGKTTTLAALIDLINANRAEHIITIEDPIEFVHPSKKAHVNQREVGVHTRSFANALRASLREAPDVIMVGEMRDLETIGLAITAAETGHLVFGTLHTPDCQRTVNRVIDVFPPQEQPQIRSMFSESLRGVVSQHLLPGLDGTSLHLATEIMFNTTGIANLIRDNRSFQIHGVMQTHYKMGMHLMDDSLIELVKDGKVSREEALARADNVPLVEKVTAAPPPPPKKKDTSATKAEKRADAKTDVKPQAKSEAKAA